MSLDRTEIARRALASGRPDLIAQAYAYLENPLTTFTPRPDNPALGDEQTAFVNDRSTNIVCAMGGNGSGKTRAGSYAVASFLDRTPAPEPNTPFWICSQTMDMVTAVCWQQNLRQFIPTDRIASISWYRESLGRPRQVVLTPDAAGNNWVLEFKSCDQGRQALQGSSIGGFWIDEQAPLDVITELLARTRKWSFGGSRLYTLTPVAPDIDLEDRYNNREQFPGWSWYHLNTVCNDTLGAEYVRMIEQNEIPALVRTRLYGAFAAYQGMVFPSFSSRHIVEPYPIPGDWLRIRGLDPGWAHATAVVWVAIEPETKRHVVYREYNRNQTCVEDHVEAINGPGEEPNPQAWKDLHRTGATYADPENPQVLHEFALRGLTTVIAKKEIEASHATIRTLLANGPDGRPLLQIFNTCPTLIQQMRTYVYDPKTDKPMRETDKRLYDCVAALRYSVHSYSVGTVVTQKYVAPVRKTSPV